MSIINERERVLNVVCPYCKAAVKALCTEKYFNAAGVQTRETNIFHAERIFKAQTLHERCMDTAKQIQDYLNKKLPQV
jgi:glutaredoxin